MKRDCIAAARAALLLLLLSPLAPAYGQGDAAIPESVLRAPWEQHLRVLESLPMLAMPEGARREAIDRVIGDPQYSYVAAEASSAMATQLADVHAHFAAVYTALGVHEREDVRIAQVSLQKLHATLDRRDAFERDVLGALGSGSRQQIVGLATRWWNGEERAIAVKKRRASLRQAVEGLPGDEHRN
jgi:hypothetical protein